MEAIFPKKGDLITQTIVKEIRDKVRFTKQDLELFNLKTDNNGYTWDKDKETDLNFDLDKQGLRILKDSIDELDKNRQITIEIVDLCNKIKDYKLEVKNGKKEN